MDNKSNQNQRTIFIVVGRLGKNLVQSKVLPVCEAAIFSNIFVFSEEPGIPAGGVDYITLPRWLRELKPAILKRLVRILFEPLQLIYYSWKLKPCIIHGYFTNPKGLNSLIASKITHTNCIISIIGGKEEVETAFFIKQFSLPFVIWMLKQVQHITTKGNKDNTYLINLGVDKNKISTFNGAIDVTRFKYNGKEKDIDIIFAGIFDRFKGANRAVAIINNVIKELTEINAVFIGMGPLLNDMIREAEKLRLSKNIFFKGYVNDAHEYFKRSKILLFPSSNEGLSTAMLEAMACRCVPIISDVGNQTEAAFHEYNSIVVSDYNDLETFSYQVIRLLNNNSLLNTLAENAEKTIHDKYSPKVQGNICRSFYSPLIVKK